MSYSDSILYKIKGKIIIVDYIITIVIIILSMVWGYKESTIYSKNQIKILSKGLIIGIMIFLIMNAMPMLAVVKVSENDAESYIIYEDKKIGLNENTYPVIQLDNLERQVSTYPVLVFNGILIAITYILIKREYLTIDDNKDLKRYIVSISYLILANTFFCIVLSDDTLDYIAFNTILIFPLLVYNHCIYIKGNNLYDNNMIEILEEERQKMSVFLHDEVLQDLIVLSHSLKSNDMNEQLSKIIGEIRNVSQELYPTIAEDLGLEQALRIYMDDIKSDYNVEVEYIYDYPKGVLPKGRSLVVYRIVKELIINAIKHSRCTKIKVEISKVAEGIDCMVSDNGIGFLMPESEKLLKSPHMGLYTIKKQISDMNGKLRIISDKTGSEFQIYIPLGE